ncbi:hypothetical protein [Bacillus sp. 204(2023)]|uniref:hypothetical protein n=1 Tax=Bacillus sp. 204(2023) TaxID=3096766 RepID=UPI003007FBB8
MNVLETKLRKKEIDDLIDYIEDYNQKTFSKTIDNDSKDFYRFVSKQLVFFKYILNAYPNSYFIKVLISDFLSLILNDLKNERRYYYLNQRSIIENYVRLLVEDETYITHVTKQAFLDLQAKYASDITERDYGKIMNEYKIACSYIHGGEYLKKHLVNSFEECLQIKPKISKRKRKNQIGQFIDLINILNNLFLIHKAEEIDSSFHRSKLVLKYLMGTKYVEKLREINK